MGIPARPKPARDAKVVKLYLDGGKTLEQIGRRHNITKQRVHQIISRNRLKQKEVKSIDNLEKEEYTGDMKVSDASE